MLNTPKKLSSICMPDHVTKGKPHFSPTHDIVHFSLSTYLHCTSCFLHRCSILIPSVVPPMNDTWSGRTSVCCLALKHTSTIYSCGFHNYFACAWQVTFNELRCVESRVRGTVQALYMVGCFLRLSIYIPIVCALCVMY